VSAIAASPGLFASLPDRERAALEARCRHLKFPAQAYLYHEGQPGDAVYILVGGRVGVWSGGERGDPVLLTILGPGEMFGEMAILSDERVRTASTQALSRVEVVQILRGDIESLRERYPRINEVFIDSLLRLVQRLTTQVAELSELDTTTRLYRQLWRLGEVFDRRRTGGELPISQQELASMTGVGLRITNRVLNEARVEGTLDTGKRRIVVNDWAMVRRRAGLRFRSG
jgi:CRP/FNR family transcriptional regulator, cyclic AMP receptor protein